MSEKNKECFEKQIRGLWLILDDAPESEIMISRAYVKEKLRMILGNGINFHQDIKENLNLCKRGLKNE